MRDLHHGAKVMGQNLNSKKETYDALLVKNIIGLQDGEFITKKGLILILDDLKKNNPELVFLLFFSSEICIL